MLEELTAIRSMTKSSQLEPKEQYELVQSDSVSHEYTQRYQRMQMRQWSSSLFRAIHLEAMGHKDFLYLALMVRKLVEKEALRILNKVLRRILAVLDKIRYGGVLIRLNMRVRRGKTSFR